MKRVEMLLFIMRKSARNFVLTDSLKTLNHLKVGRRINDMTDSSIINWRSQFDSGIYKITNTVNGKVYIGQSIHLRQRIRFHKTYEHNKHLKRAFKKYGLEKFTFEIIKETYDLDFWERFFIYWYRANNPRYGYNILKGGDSCPSKNERTKKQMSKSIKKFYNSEEGKKLIKKIINKKKETISNWSEEKKAEVKQNMSNAQKKIYVLCINRKLVKFWHLWKVEDNKEITIHSKKHMFQVYDRDIVYCKGEYFVSFENKYPTKEEIEMYYEQLEYIDKTWHALRNAKTTIPFKFKCLENGKIYNDSEIGQFKDDNNIISNTLSYIKVEIRKCCNGKRDNFNGFHFEYA